MALRLPESWVWDSWFVFDGENHHAFYLRASRALIDPNRRHRQPYVGHAISKDLTNWEVVQDAIALSDPPAFDSWTTWTGSVVRDDSGLWWMFYTGTSKEDGGNIQRIGAATSMDLLSWEKVSQEALVEADGDKYELLDYKKWHDQAWRDPWVFRHQNLWHMLITSRFVEDGKSPTKQRGAVGHAVSDDLRKWEVLSPLNSAPSGFGQLEVFQVEQIEGKTVLLFCCGTNELPEESIAKYGQGGVFSLVVETPLGPFDTQKAVRFDHPSLYAARLVQHKGVWNLIGFRDLEDGAFVGELTDPIPVKISGNGLVRA
ncbi:MAG: glycosyl hydrolase family 32 [Actinomycetota bacterium]